MGLIRSPGSYFNYSFFCTIYRIYLHHVRKVYSRIIILDNPWTLYLPSCSSAPKDQFAALVAKGGKLNEADIEAVYNNLPALPIDFLRAEWKGGSFDTGHPGHTQLLSMNWLGKTFHSTESVDPIVVSKDGKRVCDESWGHAVVS